MTLKQLNLKDCWKPNLDEKKDFNKELANEIDTKLPESLPRLRYADFTRFSMNLRGFYNQKWINMKNYLLPGT